MTRWITRKRGWLLGLSVFVAIAFVFLGQFDRLQPVSLVGEGDRLLAQEAPLPPPPPQTLPPTQQIPVSTKLTPVVTSPVTSASPLPVPPPPPPASTAPALPLGGDYQDPGGRFKVGVLKNYTTSPLAGSVLIESPDGNLAYTVVAQAQPAGVPIGLSLGFNTDALAKAATIVFQRGEGFQPGLAQPEAGGGIVINWTGSLTIAGKAQPMGGVILVRPSPKEILFALVAATQAGADQVPGAVAAIANSLQPL